MDDLQFFEDLCKNNKVPDEDIRNAFCELWNKADTITTGQRAIGIMLEHRPTLSL